MTNFKDYGRLLNFLTIISAILAETQILDYTNSQIITIEMGTARLQTGTFKIVHIIELDEYQKAITDIERTLDEHIPAKDSSYIYLKHDIAQVKNILNGLQPRRQIRSLDILGTAWKWLAGTPDHDDFQLIDDRTNNLIRNNDRQVTINKLTMNRLDEVSKITNKLLNTIQSTDIYEKQIIIGIERKLKIIKEELVQIDYSIQWTKANIVNSFILSNLEMNLTKKFFEEQDIPFTNLIEALEFSEIKIASNHSTLIYVISLPNTNKMNCNRYLVKSVKKGNISIKLPFKDIITCNQHVLGIKNKCKTLNNLSICKTTNIVNITNSDCIPKLMKSLPSKCTTTNNQHLPLVEEISTNILLLNNHNGEIQVDNKTVSLRGTFLIHHRNSTVVIQNQTYWTKEITAAKPLPAIAQSTNLTNIFQEVLSLEMLKDLHMTNTEEISIIKYRYGTSLITNFIFLIIAIGLICYRTYATRNRKLKVTVVDNKDQLKNVPTLNSEDAVEFKGGRVNTLYTENHFIAIPANGTFSLK